MLQGYARLLLKNGSYRQAAKEFEFLLDSMPDNGQKQKFAKLSGDDVAATQLAGEDITAKLTEAPGNHAKIGGLKVTTENNWFAARPSGTENIYKVYAESFESPEALDKVLAEATEVVDKALAE